VKKEDSFFNGITMNKIMKSHKSKRTAANDTKQKQKIDIDNVNKKYNERMKNIQENPSMPMISENSSEHQDRDEDIYRMQNLSHLNIHKNQSVRNSMQPHDMLSVPKIDKLDQDSESAQSQEVDVMNMTVDDHYYDRQHFLPDSYEGTEATKKKISRLFDQSPTKIVPVIENCNRPAVEFFFKGSNLGQVDDSFYKNRHRLNQDRLIIVDRLDQKNFEMCPFLDVSCCNNDEMNEIRVNFDKKVAYMERLNKFVYGRYKAIFELKAKEIDQIFGATSDNFIEQCVGNNATYVRSVIDFMETDSFEYDLKIKQYTKQMIELTQYFSCKLCDANDNHRTFHYDQANDQLKIYGNQTLALHFLKLKLLELSIGIFARKVTFLSKLVLCKVKKVSQLKMNEEENGSIRWVQNFYRKCKGELFYLLPEDFNLESELFEAMPREDLNEYLALQVSLEKVGHKKPKDLSDMSISESCRKVLFGNDSNLLNFRDNFDIVRLTEFNYQVLTKFFTFLSKGTEFMIPTRDEWHVLEQSFNFNLNDFKERFKDSLNQKGLGSGPHVNANELYPFVHSVMSLEVLHASHNVSFSMKKSGIEYSFLKKFQTYLLESVSSWSMLVISFLTVLLAFK
jgi:hypothetical protein